MAETLMQNLRKRLESPAATEAGAGRVEDQTERAQSLLRARLGKAATPGVSPRISAMQERQAVSQAAQAAGRQQLTGALAGQQLEQQQLGLEAKEQQQQLNIAERHKDIQSQFARQSKAILNDLERGKLDIESQRDKAKLEQLGFNIRLQSEQYISNLQRAGAQNRLQNAQQFKEQIARQEIGQDETLTKMGVDYKQLSDLSEREFRQQIANMDIQFARDLAHQQRLQEMEQAKYAAIGGLTQAGTTAYGKGMFSKSETGAPTTEKLEGER